MTKTTVAIIDDHTLFAQSLKSLINTFNNYTVSHEAHNGKVFLNQLKDTDRLPDIALMDMNMPILNGLETTNILNKEYPTIKVLALSMDDDQNSILKMIRSGARGYLLKDIHPDVLLEALTSVLHDGFYHTKLVSNSLVNSLKPLPKKQKDNPIEFLGRELEFLKLASTEMTYKEIAEVMSLSPKTVDGYRDQLFKKLNVKNRIGLVVYAIKNDLA